MLEEGHAFPSLFPDLTVNLDFVSIPIPLSTVAPEKLISLN
jgi:hypothetical protein